MRRNKKPPVCIRGGILVGVAFVYLIFTDTSSTKRVI